MTKGGGTVVVSTGVVFGLEKMPVMILQEINKQAQKNKPKVPVKYVESKSREEEYPEDPDYLKAMDEWHSEVGLRGIDSAIVFGTKIHELPEGFPKPEDTQWSDDLELVGIEIPQNGKSRYLAWVKLCAAPADKDLEKITLACTRLLGVSEADVASASELFRSRATRKPNRKPKR